MNAPAIELTGMPYVAGAAHGPLQRGLMADPAGKIILLESPQAEPARHRPAGYLVIGGSPFSHAMIPLLGSGVPCILLTREQARDLQDGMLLHMDGATGRLTSDAPDPGGQARLPRRGAAVMTRDGETVSLRVSVRDQAAVQRAVEMDAEAVGLLRSEYLLPAAGQVPDARFYRDAFRAACVAAAGRPVTVRLLDVAASKCPAWLGLREQESGMLGRQGVRLYTDEPVRGVYRAQLHALDELAGEYDLRILLPYVGDADELRHWHGDIRRRLGHRVPIGAMAETPASALQLHEWLEVADFVGIGCNDLMQCLFGADRDNPAVRRYLDPHAPSLYRFLGQVAASVEDRLDAVQLCGVLPQLPGILPLLLGLGYRAFSVEANQLPYLRASLAATHTADARNLAAEVSRSENAGEVRRLLASARA